MKERIGEIMERHCREDQFGTGGARLGDGDISLLRLPRRARAVRQRQKRLPQSECRRLAPPRAASFRLISVRTSSRQGRLMLLWYANCNCSGAPHRMPTCCWLLSTARMQDLRDERSRLNARRKELLTGENTYRVARMTLRLSRSPSVNRINKGNRASASSSGAKKRGMDAGRRPIGKL